MERITSALDIKEEHIKERENKGEFHIRLTTCNSTWYDLSFGGDNMMPKCTCTDFTRTGLPCKHFFAVFEHSKEWKWDALPERYCENPHVSLDNAIVFGNADYDEFSISEGQTDPQQPIVPQPKVQARMAKESQLMHEAMKCRETMKEITSLTYNVVDVNALQN